MLTEQEKRSLIMRLAAGSQEIGGFTESEAERLIEWAHQTRTDAGLLQLLLEGRANVRIEADGELAFTAVPAG